MRQRKARGGRMSDPHGVPDRPLNPPDPDMGASIGEDGAYEQYRVDMERSGVCWFCESREHREGCPCR